VPLLGSLALLALLSTLFITTNLSVGYTFSTIAQNQLQAMQMSMMFFLPNILLSGFMFPFAGMPNWAQWIGEALPLTHFIRIVRAIMLKGAGAQDLHADAWALIGFSLVLAMAVGRGLLLDSAGEHIIDQRRSPYGVYRVVDTEVPGKPRARALESGHTRHGEQLFHADGTFDPTPLTYYNRQSPLAEVVAALPRPRRLGVIGLGIGTIAGLLDAEDSVVFYEIDPVVEELARSHFGYLSSPPRSEIRIGDARRELAREAELGAPRYQLLVIDAFTGDSIPVHLLTIEALALYLERIEPGSLVLLHTSNRFVPLIGMIGAGANALGSVAVAQIREGDLPHGATPSQFAAIGNVEHLGWPRVITSRSTAWSDDHSSLLPLFVWRFTR